MYKPMDFPKIHIRAKVWATRVYESYHESRMEHIPTKAQPAIGGEDGIPRQQIVETERPDNVLGSEG